MSDFNFLEVDTQEILTKLIADFEAVTGETLAVSDSRTLFVHGFAYVLSQIKNDINITGRNNLVKYAYGKYLDEIADLFGVTRKTVTLKATTFLKFSMQNAIGNETLIPKGTRATPDGVLLFETDEDTVIASGETEVVVSATATEPGAEYNGFKSGQVNKLVDGVANISAVTNISETAGGTDNETDDLFRERILQAPFSYSTAGSENAYKNIALSASEDIADIQVYSSAAGTVNIAVVKTNGVLPTANDDVITAVQNACDAKTVRPLTDYVVVEPAEAVNTTVDIEYWISVDDTNDINNIKDAVIVAIAEYKKWQTTAIGRDINPDKLRKLLLNAGVAKVTVKSPVETTVGNGQVAQITNINYVYKGLCE